MNKLRSDAALKAVKHESLKARCATIASVETTKNDLILHVSAKASRDGEWIDCEVSFNDIISKRKSLRGINARLKAAVRKSRKTKRKK